MASNAPSGNSASAEITGPQSKRPRWTQNLYAAGACPGLPVAGVRHRSPRLGRRLGLALLPKLDRVQVRRADEGHHAVARRPVDGDTGLHQAVACRVDVVDLIGEVAEIAVLAVFFFFPIVGQFDQRRAAALGRVLEEAFVLRSA